MSLYDLGTPPTMLLVAAVLGLFVIAGGAILWARLRKQDAEFFERIEERNSEMMDDDTYSMEEMMDRMEKTMRVGRKYYNRNTRRGGMFRFEHPISKRRGQKFLDELTPGLSSMINNRIARQKPGRVIEQKPAKNSRYRAGRKYRRYFGNNR